MTEKLGLLLKCPNPLCRHEWEYRGMSKFYASCPFCRTNVHVAKNRVTRARSEKDRV